jgi:hypothetical protein
MSCIFGAVGLSSGLATVLAALSAKIEPFKGALQLLHFSAPCSFRVPQLLHLGLSLRALRSASEAMTEPLSGALQCSQLILLGALAYPQLLHFMVKGGCCCIDVGYW